MTTKKGVWNLQQVRDKQLQDLWSYSGELAWFTWGNNTNGELGQNDTAARSSPTQIPGTTWVKGSGTAYQSAAIKTDGTLWVMGNNYNRGTLGQNNGVNYSSPVQIPGTTWSEVDVGETYFMAAIKTDGTLWTWGYNQSGELGQNSNSTSHRSSPVQIPGTTWSSIAASNERCHAIRTDGTLWSWGSGYYGWLGNNTSANPSLRSSPVQCPGTTWSVVNGGKYHTLATKTDGTLWAWGYAGDGRLGQNNNTDRSSPVQIGSGTDWATCSAGFHGSGAIKTDGTMWIWGLNQVGALGQNLPISTAVSSPVQIPGTTWNDIQIAGYYYRYATKTDGTLWAWGSNYRGMLGQNQAESVAVSSPVQVPGSDYTYIKSGANDGIVAFRSL